MGSILFRYYKWVYTIILTFLTRFITVISPTTHSHCVNKNHLCLEEFFMPPGWLRLYHTEEAQLAASY